MVSGDGITGGIYYGAFPVFSLAGGLVVLLVSALLTAGYLLPVTVRDFFREKSLIVNVRGKRTGNLYAAADYYTDSIVSFGRSISGSSDRMHRRTDSVRRKEECV